MEDKNDIMLKQLFSEAAQQQIEDNGFTDRVMANLPERSGYSVRTLSRLWTMFCLIIGMLAFWLASGYSALEGFLSGAKQMLITTIEVFLATAPTTEIQINPWVVVLLLVFVLIFLPYQTFRKLSATL
jgi:hypothetical protein